MMDCKTAMHFIMTSLASDTEDDPLRVFHPIDVHDGLEGDLVEVEPVAHVVVGGDGLGVVVEHDGLLAEGAQLADAPDRAPVELDGAADPVQDGPCGRGIMMRYRVTMIQSKAVSCRWVETMTSL